MVATNISEKCYGGSFPREGAAICPVGHRIVWFKKLLGGLTTTLQLHLQHRDNRTIGARRRHTILRTVSPPTLPLVPFPFFKPTSSTSPTQYHPITHMARPQKKAQDWSLAGSKPIRILGDSNINHIPPHTNPTLQLDCYPGAKVYHFMELFKRTPPIPTAKIVIISIDINNKDDDPERTHHH
ncbi:hypothetical protein KUCAC02_002890 [Chaenocephalus aceratus]|uniref:Uncharacterized protein n=1 Tax=Chaenocephalus aceratus TaxID=36190 RepID=A0ACB9WKM5_CHAAC|nr:hypothetical protein KUCAC02_002890 [Chaenocephalus aceratus]